MIARNCRPPSPGIRTQACLGVGLGITGRNPAREPDFGTVRIHRTEPSILDGSTQDDLSGVISPKSLMRILLDGNILICLENASAELNVVSAVFFGVSYSQGRGAHGQK
jgi:hypothetical protein